MAAVAWVDIGPKVETEAKEEVRLVWGGRAVEGRVAHGSYTPYSADRGDWAPLARSAGVVADPGSLAGEFLWRGEAGDLIRAEETLRRQPKEPARENDIGVLLLAQERYREAAAAFDRVLAKEPQMLAALFNAALAQEKLGNRARAAAAWERYLDVAAERDEAGWIEEAEAYLQASTKAASVR